MTTTPKCAKCGHAIKAHMHGACCPFLDTSFCSCRVDFAALDQAVIDAAEKMSTPEHSFSVPGKWDELEALQAAIIARREARA